MMHQHDSVTAAGARALITATCLLASGRPVRSVVICDDRPAAAQGMAAMLRPLPSLVAVECVQDGFALVDAYLASAFDVVLIGVHRVSRVGQEAMSLIFGMHPTAVVMVVGSVVNADLLADAYVRGAGALLVWELNQAPQPDGYPDGPLVW